MEFFRNIPQALSYTRWRSFNETSQRRQQAAIDPHDRMIGRHPGENPRAAADTACCRFLFDFE